MRKYPGQKDYWQVVKGAAIMKNKFIHFDIDKENIIGMANGLGIILFSCFMTIFENEIVNIIIRDILMILVLGFFFPLYYTIVANKKPISVLGIKKEKILVSLIINLAAAILLLAMFLLKNKQPVSFSKNSFYAVTYI